MGPNTLLTSPLFHVHLNHRDDKPPLRMKLFTAPVHVREWPTGMVSQLEWLHSVAHPPDTGHRWLLTVDLTISLATALHADDVGSVYYFSFAKKHPLCMVFFCLTFLFLSFSPDSVLEHGAL